MAEPGARPARFSLPHWSTRPWTSPGTSSFEPSRSHLINDAVRRSGTDSPRPPLITVAVGTTIAGRPPRRSVRARLRIRLLLWMKGGETCCWPHTVQSLGHALPALCRTHVGWNDVLLSPCPSLPSLRRRLLPFVVRLVHGYYGTVRLLLYVHVRRAVYGLRGPVLVG